MIYMHLLKNKFHMRLTCMHTVVKGEQRSPDSEFAVRTVGLLLRLVGELNQFRNCLFGNMFNVTILNMHHLTVGLGSCHDYGCIF